MVIKKLKMVSTMENWLGHLSMNSHWKTVTEVAGFWRGKSRGSSTEPDPR